MHHTADSSQRDPDSAAAQDDVEPEPAVIPHKHPDALRRTWDQHPYNTYAGPGQQGMHASPSRDAVHHHHTDAHPHPDQTDHSDASNPHPDAVPICRWERYGMLAAHRRRVLAEREQHQSRPAQTDTAAATPTQQGLVPSCEANCGWPGGCRALRETAVPDVVREWCTRRG
ncbi:hypothetical protein E4U54_000230 [Claviceps lovelessii]|nr:hypothetical protein E4U54_000230 [Claviceps lovelessii]